jgi:hypothetical protein
MTTISLLTAEECKIAIAQKLYHIASGVNHRQTIYYVTKEHHDEAMRYLSVCREGATKVYKVDLPDLRREKKIPERVRLLIIKDDNLLINDELITLLDKYKSLLPIVFTVGITASAKYWMRLLSFPIYDAGTSCTMETIRPEIKLLNDASWPSFTLTYAFEHSLQDNGHTATAFADGLLNRKAILASDFSQKRREFHDFSWKNDIKIKLLQLHHQLVVLLDNLDEKKDNTMKTLIDFNNLVQSGGANNIFTQIGKLIGIQGYLSICQS